MNAVQLRRLVGENCFSVSDVARMLGYETSQGFLMARKAGRFPQPDFVFSKSRAFYKASSVRKILETATNGNVSPEFLKLVARPPWARKR